ncbi:MAG: hypothetical protein AAGD05_14700, partial [Bacteroidota bacterium]
MKKRMFVFGMAFLSTFLLWGQAVRLSGDLATNAPSRLKGSVKKIEQWHYDNSMLFLDLTFHYIFEYQNNRATKTITDLGKKLDVQKSHYHPDGRIIRTDYESHDSLGQYITTTGYRSYTYQGNTTKVQYHSGQSLISETTLQYDQHGRLVTVRKYNNQGQLFEEHALTYDFETTEKRLLNHRKQSYSADTVSKSQVWTYEYRPDLIGEQACTRINITEAVTQGNHSNEYHSREYITKAGEALGRSSNFYDKIQLHRSAYQYDQRGNWISRVTYNKVTGETESYFQRRITYSDGWVSGTDEFVLEKIKSKKFPPTAKDYFYKKFPKKGRYRLLDGLNKNISRRMKWLGYAQTQSAFVYDTVQQAVIELIDYKKVNSKY